MQLIHKHHIIPKHFFKKPEWQLLQFSLNDPKNIRVLSVEEHAKAHKHLYEIYGYWEDLYAWQFLSGQIPLAEAIKKSQIQGGLNQKKKFGSENPFYGRKHSTETKEKIRQSKIGQIPPNKGVFGANNSRSRTWQITTPEGEIVVVKGLTQYCRENDLCYQVMGQVAKGKWKQHKGYKCEEIVSCN